MGRLWQSDPGRVFADLDAWSKNIETAIRCPK
jgi:hypothetical protein